MSGNPSSLRSEGRLFFPQPPAGGELEDNLRFDGEHVMQWDTEDKAVPDLRQELKSDLSVLIQVAHHPS